MDINATSKHTCNQVFDTVTIFTTSVNAETHTQTTTNTCSTITLFLTHTIQLCRSNHNNRVLIAMLEHLSDRSTSPHKAVVMTHVFKWGAPSVYVFCYGTMTFNVERRLCAQAARASSLLHETMTSKTERARFFHPPSLFVVTVLRGACMCQTGLCAER